jgi:hypothetical protein
MRDIGLPRGRAKSPPRLKHSSVELKRTLWLGLLLAVIFAFLIYRLASAF